MKRFFAVSVLLLGLSASLVFAQGGADLAGSLEAFRVVMNEEGVENFLPADNARPSDVIEYRLTYTNKGDKALQNISITDPIPFGTVFIDASATQPDASQVEFSIDGGKAYQPWPILIKKTTKDGKEEFVEATPDMVTHIRWALNQSIEPEQRITVAYRTVIK